jgi:hypothetical protein
VKWRFCKSYASLAEPSMCFRAAPPARVAFVFAVASLRQRKAAQTAGGIMFLLGFVLLGQQEPMKHTA